MKLLLDSNLKDNISSIILLLSQEFCLSSNTNHRKGGLIGLGAIAITFLSSGNVANQYNTIDGYLSMLVLPVLECFNDLESRIVYYACETLYNIIKVARSSILVYFDEIFDGLCKLMAHVDVDVKNGKHLFRLCLFSLI